MNKKTRADCIWDKLAPEQLVELERWLFEENIAFRDAHERARRHFNAPGSLESLRGWYHRTAQRRMIEIVSLSAEGAGAVVKQMGRKAAEQYYEALLGMIGQGAFRKAVERGEDIDLESLKELAELTQVGLKAHVEMRQLRLKMRDLALKAEMYRDRKAALAKQAAPPLQAGLTDEMLEEIERELKLM